MSSLPDQYRILPEIIDFELSGFRHAGGKSLSLRMCQCGAWFEEFVARIVDAVDDSHFLPVCRLSDGEFAFALGQQPDSVRLPRTERIRRAARRRIFELARGGAFAAGTRPGVSSGSYSRKEWQLARAAYPEQVRAISEKGILALHLTFGPVPFQEHYFPALDRWLRANNILITDQNYFPFYFVYALLSGPSAQRIIAGKRLLLVNAAKPPKRTRIEQTLMSLGAEDVTWCQISASRSFFDRIDVSAFSGCVDVAFVGAGVGKPNILLQLEPLRVPVIDAGYMIEVWSDSALAARRSFCLYDAAAQKTREGSEQSGR